MKILISIMSTCGLMLVLALALAQDEETLIVETAVDVELAATLTMPDTSPPHPLAVLIAGSGKQNRNADNMVPGYAPHAQWAELLAKQGVASLRYDERGVGASGGDWEAMTFADHVGDITALIEAVSAREAIDADRLVLVGHSEGSLLATAVASDMPALGGLVLLAGPALKIDEILNFQALNNTPRGDLSDEDHAAAVAQARASVMARIRAVPNYRSLLNVDPARLLEDVRMPLLIAHGSEDTQVPPGHAAELARIALESGNDDVTVRVLPNTGHLLIDPNQSTQEQKPLSPVLQHLVLSWLESRLQRNADPSCVGLMLDDRCFGLSQG